MSLQKRVFAIVAWCARYLHWLPPFVQAAATVGSSVAFLFVFAVSGELDSVALTWGISLAFVSVASTLLIDLWRRQAKKWLVGERVQLQTTLNDAITPLLRDLGKMSAQDSGARARTLEGIIGRVSAALPLSLPEATRLRVVVYNVEPASGRRKRRLIPHRATGRSDAPRRLEDGDNAKGSRVFAWLDSGGSPTFVADVGDSEDHSGRAYRTYVSTGMVLNNKLYGMVSVDSPNPGDLDESDKTIVEVYASLLAVAYAFAERA